MEKKVKSIKELFTLDFLTDILSTAFYGSPWFVCSANDCNDVELVKEAQRETTDVESKWAYILLHGGVIKVEDPEDEKEYKLSLNKIINGFKIVMLNYPENYCNIMTENGDFCDADCVIQCAVFGELTYA